MFTSGIGKELVVSKKVVVGLVSVALVAGLAAQEVGGGAGGFGSETREAGGSLRAPTRFEQFIGKLKMDSKTQAPLVTTMLQDVAKEASPVGGQMTQLQNQLLNALLLNKSEAEIRAIPDAYSEAAARMTGLEARTFGKIYAMLKPNQQGGAVQAFDLMAGWLQPPPPNAGGRGGGRRGAGGGASSLPRLDILIDSFTLTKDQEKAVKTLMDDAGKSAMPVRNALAKARPVIVAAIQGGKGQADIDAAVNAYAAQATAMAEREMRTLAMIMQVLTPEQRANQAAVRSTFFLMRGAFLSKNWNEAPNPDKGY